MLKKDEILLIDKPKGVSSFDVIRTLRRKLRVEKMGHAGTLDPLATGLLIVGVEKGTKHLSRLIGLPKRYVAEITLGIRTDTGDLDGAVLETATPALFTETEIKEKLKSLEGEIRLAVPLYSAIKKKGIPLYKYARSGKVVELPVKKMKVMEATFLEYDQNVIKVEFFVSSGTYIRSLAEELAKRLGTIAALQNLRRTAVGEFLVDNANAL